MEHSRVINVLILISALISSAAQAEDAMHSVEMCFQDPPYSTVTTTTTETISGARDPVNIMLILDDSGSMTWPMNGSAVSRWEALTQHIDTMTQSWLDDINAGNIPPINLGVTFLRSVSPRGYALEYSGGYIGYPALPLTADNRRELLRVIDNNPVQGFTSLGDAYEETARYLRGDRMYWGSHAGGFNPFPGPLSLAYEGVSHLGSVLLIPPYYDNRPGNPSPCYLDFNESSRMNCQDHYYGDGRVIQWGHPTNLMEPENEGTPFYNSPISQSEIKSHIILFSDGEANKGAYDGRIDRIATDLLGKRSIDECTIIPSVQPRTGGYCMVDLAQMLVTTDQSPQPGTQLIRTHVISYRNTMDRSAAFMEEVAKAGDGIHVLATDFATLKNGFDQIFEEILKDATETETTSEHIYGPGEYPSFELPFSNISLSSLKLLKDRNNILQHDKTAYGAIYTPHPDSAWQGDLIKYDLTASPSTPVDVSDERYAIGTHPDGATTHLPAEADRKLYSNFNSSASLFDSSNLINEANITAFLTSKGLGEYYGTSLMASWLRKQFIGDIMHSSPVSVDYDTSAKGKVERVVFVGTNQGYLHAIDGDTMKELWAFMPKQLIENNLNKLANLSAIPASHNFKLEPFQDLPPTAQTSVTSPKISSHIYGMDATPTLWIKNEGDLDKIEGSDRVMLYMGMRRGGRDYFAFDVTDREKPILKWHIKGGTPGFEALGQTWSEPTLANINYRGTPKKVVIFGGGYNGKYDYQFNVSASREESPLSPTAVATFKGGKIFDPDVGNRIFIVDAEDGTLLWTAGPPELTGRDKEILPAMNEAIVAQVATIDVDKDPDGLIDKFFVGDLGGQLWRCDIDNSKKLINQAIHCGLEASIAGVTAPNYREDRTAAASHQFRPFFYKPDVFLAKNALDPSKVDFIAVNIGSGSRPQLLATNSNEQFFSFFITDDILTQKKRWGTPIKQVDLINTTGASAVVPPGGKGWYIDLNGSPASTPAVKTISESVTLLGLVMFKTAMPTAITTPAPGKSCLGELAINIRIRELLTGKAPQYKDDDGTIQTLDTIPANTLDGSPLQFILRGGQGGVYERGKAILPHQALVINSSLQIGSSLMSK